MPEFQRDSVLVSAKVPEKVLDGARIQVKVSVCARIPDNVPDCDRGGGARVPENVSVSARIPEKVSAGARFQMIVKVGVREFQRKCHRVLDCDRGCQDSRENVTDCQIVPAFQ